MYTLNGILWTDQYRVNNSSPPGNAIGITVHARDWATQNFGPLYNDPAPGRRDHLRMTTLRQIVAFGWGGFSMESGDPLLDGCALGLTGGERPKVCFMPAAGGDADRETNARR